MQKKSQLLNSFEERFYQRGFTCIAGVDEAGRGPLAGPVVAAACIFPLSVSIEGIDDSKKLSPLKRYALYEKLMSTDEICLGIGVVDALRIDQINILQATFEAMLLAVANLAKRPDYLLVDGNLMPPISIPGEAIVGGDGCVRSIAAASIAAKVVRDRMMMDYDAIWPQYGFKEHKGYPTEKHMAALDEHGATPIHRRTFEPVRRRLS